MSTWGVYASLGLGVLEALEVPLETMRPKCVTSSTAPTHTSSDTCEQLFLTWRGLPNQGKHTPLTRTQHHFKATAVILQNSARANHSVSTVRVQGWSTTTSSVTWAPRVCYKTEKCVAVTDPTGPTAHQELYLPFKGAKLQLVSDKHCHKAT